MSEATKAVSSGRRYKINPSLWRARWQTGFGLFGFRGWGVAAIAAVLALVIIGIPTAMIDNPLFIRMTPARTQDYVIWITTALLMGLVGGTFTVRQAKGSAGKGASGGALSFFATGCPICNKLVVSLLGVSGAFTYFAPLQIYLGIASIALLLWTLHLRLSAINRSCCIVPDDSKALNSG